MATRTFAVIKSSAYANGDKWGYQTAEKLRQDLDLLARCGLSFDLGGDERAIVTGAATWRPVNGRRRITLDGDNFGGLTLNCFLSYFTLNAATAVQLRLRNLTDGSTPTGGTGTASTAVTITDETLTLTLPSGAKQYELQILGDATNGVVGWGYLWFAKAVA